MSWWWNCFNALLANESQESEKERERERQREANWKATSKRKRKKLPIFVRYFFNLLPKRKSNPFSFSSCSPCHRFGFGIFFPFKSNISWLLIQRFCYLRISTDCACVPVHACMRNNIRQLEKLKRKINKNILWSHCCCLFHFSFCRKNIVKTAHE